MSRGDGEEAKFSEQLIIYFKPQRVSTNYQGKRNRNILGRVKCRLVSRTEMRPVLWKSNKYRGIQEDSGKSAVTMLIFMVYDENFELL